jgi:hypothetical protein
VVEALVESMSFRHIGVVAEEYAVSKDGMRMFAVLDLETGFEGCRFAIGLRNSHDKSFRLSCTVGSCIRLREPGVQRGLHRGVGKTLEKLLARR